MPQSTGGPSRLILTGGGAGPGTPGGTQRDAPAVLPLQDGATHAPGADRAAHTGLSDQEAAARLQEEGYNELPTTRRRSVLTIAWDVAREPIFLLLGGGGVIYLVIGDLTEALLLLAFVLVVLGITLYQERCTERALEALRDL